MPPPPPPPRPDAVPSTGLLVIAGPLAAGDVAMLCERLEAVIASSDVQLIVCDVAALVPSAGAVEALARLQLTARRLQRHIRLQRASPCLQELLDFVGLGDVITVRDASGGQRRRNVEQREYPLGIEKRVDRDDPPV